MRKKGFTLIELLVVIAIIAMLLAILMPALNKVKKIAQRVVCGTNLKGLGTAQVVYANDYEDAFVIQGGTGLHTWAANTANWQDVLKNWSAGANITVGASLYLLVREADVSPKSFVCGGGAETAYDGENARGLDITELWDFGIDNPAFDNGPTRHVSYSYQMPYAVGGGAGRNAADGTKSAAFVVMGDKSPWYDPKLQVGTPTAGNFVDFVAFMAAYYNPPTKEKWSIQVANTQAHSREGQNVLFGDGHSAYEKTTDVGVRHDGMYTVRANTNENTIRRGDQGITYSAFVPLEPLGGEDSFLVNDDGR